MIILNECKAAENGSDDDVSQIAAQKLPIGPNAKCFLACFYEHLGVVSPLKCCIDFSNNHCHPFSFRFVII